MHPTLHLVKSATRSIDIDFNIMEWFSAVSDFKIEQQVATQDSIKSKHKCRKH